MKVLYGLVLEKSAYVIVGALGIWRASGHFKV
jgi:hypothetical protein